MGCNLVKFEGPKIDFDFDVGGPQFLEPWYDFFINLAVKMSVGYLYLLTHTFALHPLFWKGNNALL